MAPTTYAPLHDAVSRLAARCDGARTLDGQGFSAADASLGKRLAQVPSSVWTEQMAHTAWTILRGYQSQLIDMGIIWANLPSPTSAVGPAAGTTQPERIVTVTPSRPRIVRDARWAELIGSRVHCHFRYDEQIMEDVRAIKGRSWEPDTRTWSVPLASRYALRDFLTRWDFAYDDEVATAMSLATFVKEELGPVTAMLTGSFVMIKCDPKDEHAAGYIRAMPGYSYAKEMKAFTVPLNQATLDSLSAFLQAFDVDAPDVVAAIAASRLRSTSLKELSKALHSDLEVMLPGGELRPYQRVAVQYFLEVRRGILADSMGAGKTIEAMAIVEMAGETALPCLIVCPATLKPNWQRELQRWLPHRFAVSINGSRRQSVGFADFVVINYDILGAHAERFAGQGFNSIIFDESVAIKNPKAQRTQAALEIAASVPTSGIKLCLSGTPVKNRLNELAMQLQAVDQLHHFGGSAGALVSRWDGDEFGLHDMLTGVCYVRRTTQDILPDLPPMRHIPYDCPTDERLMEEYRTAERDIANYLAEKAREVARLRGEDPHSAGVEAAMRANAAIYLVTINTLKKLAVRARMEGAITWVREWLDENEDTQAKILLFAHEIAVCDRLAREFDCPTIYGQTPQSERPKIVDRFQNNSDDRVLVLNIQTGGTGLTLTAAQDVCFFELAWSPGDHDQAIGRTYGRANDPHGAAGYYMIAPDTIDMMIVDKLDSKRKVIDAATDGVVTDSETSVLGDILVHLMNKGLAA